MDAYIFPGKIMDSRPAGVQEAIAPLPHAVQPRNPIRHHRHGFHEREPVRPRRQGVRPYRHPHGNRAQGDYGALER